MARVTKAIIPVAGYGTRRLPIVKAIEKCMLPVCNRPIIDYSVEECIKAGIEDIFFVVAPDFTQLRSYYSTNVELEHYLAKRGKQGLLESIKDIPRKANFHYIIQDPAGAYGTAVPIWVARDAISSGEQFLITYGDDFIFYPDGASDVTRLIAANADAALAGAILCTEKPNSELSKYGVIKMSAAKNKSYPVLDSIVEKPTNGSAPSNLVSVAYHILDKDIMPHIERVLHQPSAGGEHYLTDAINAYAAAGNNILVVSSHGQHLDGGQLEGWIEANNTIFGSGQ